MTNIRTLCATRHNGAIVCCTCDVIVKHGEDSSIELCLFLENWYNRLRTFHLSYWRSKSRAIRMFVVFPPTRAMCSGYARQELWQLFQNEPHHEVAGRRSGKQVVVFELIVQQYGISMQKQSQCELKGLFHSFASIQRKTCRNVRRIEAPRAKSNTHTKREIRYGGAIQSADVYRKHSVRFTSMLHIK